MSGPTRRERLKPLELVAMSGGLGLFTGVIAFLGTREIQLALIFAGVAFIAGLLVLAMLALAAGPEQEADIDRPVLEQRDAERAQQGTQERPQAGADEGGTDEGGTDESGTDRP